MPKGSLLAAALIDGCGGAGVMKIMYSSKIIIVGYTSVGKNKPRCPPELRTRNGDAVLKRMILYNQLGLYFFYIFIVKAKRLRGNKRRN